MQSVYFFFEGDFNLSDNTKTKNRIDCINVSDKELIKWLNKKSFIQKAEVHINKLKISDKTIEIFREFPEFKLENLKVDELSLTMSKAKLSNKSIEVLNQINPQSYFIYNLNWYYDDFKLLLLMNSINLEFKVLSKTILELTFLTY